MDKRYSEMTKEELDYELLKLKEASMKKHQAGFFSEAAVLEQKFYMAKSYTLDPSRYLPGQAYQVTGYEGDFTISYMNGVMAWGHFKDSSEEVAFPIGRLTSVAY
ncbi:YfhH family protein [Ammoniphilus sp. YIM 78166]|uniref:YfhH family protein n=1 Tax=Ammoniphilus sp. YIM 78166 TaxID=1644106 RepID=UPI00106F0F7A|nr:YfhH family protein [Ammoniphilus sp. YIM 78166]